MIKTVSLLLAILLLTVSNVSAQKTENFQSDVNKYIAVQQHSEVKKGYYSIYENVEKLHKKISLPKIISADAIGSKSVSKGFFTISNNHKKLQFAPVVAASAAPLKASKGFYSIQPAIKAAE